MAGERLQGFRLSPQQRRLWWLGERWRAPDGHALISLQGALDDGRLRRAVQWLVARHEVLRTSFHRSTGMAVPIQVVETSAEIAWSQAELEAGADGGTSSSRAQMPLDRGPRMRAELLRRSAEDHLLRLTLPDLAADRRTFILLFEQLVDVYEARGARLEGEEVARERAQYVQFSEWQHETLADEEEMAAGREHWLARPEPAVSSLPFERRGASPATFDPDRIALDLDAAIIGLARRLVAELGVSLEAFLLACWQVTLWRAAGVEMPVEAVVDGRRFEELLDMAGPIALPVPADTPLAPRSPFSTATQSAQAALDEAARWQDAWLERSDPKAESFGAVGFEVEPWPTPRRAAGVRWRLLRNAAYTDRARLALCAVVEDERCRLELRYLSTTFDASDVRRLGGWLRALATSAVAAPSKPIDELEMLTEAERRQLTASSEAGASAAGAEARVDELFAAEAARAPDRVALVFEERRFTYGGLDRQARRLARRLRREGVGAESRVALVFEREPEMVAALLAVWKAGGAYVPIDAGQPRERLEEMLADCGAGAILTREAWRPTLPGSGLEVVCVDRDAAATTPGAVAEPEVEGGPEAAATPESLAYVIYTSGSTGRPKGVAVEHRQLASYVRAIVDRLEPPAGASYALVSTFGADLGYTSLFPALSTGGCLHVLAEERVLEGRAMADYLERHAVDCLKVVPSHLQALSAGGRPPLPRRRLVLGGEACTSAWAAELRAAAGDRRIFNHYGPSETTVGVLTHELSSSVEDSRCTSVPLGRPLAQRRVYVLDRHLRPVPTWVTGEICLGGAGVARGYLGRPARTARSFVPDAFSARPGGRMYLSGDLGRRLPDGTVEFLGRRDHQVKVRGFRVELGEVEACLARHPGVGSVVVTARSEASGQPRLVAYVVPRRRFAARIDGRERFRLPNGLAMVHKNRNETEYLYREIFEGRCYARHGLCLRSESVVFDVGANIGMFSTFVGVHRPRARLYVFEPLEPLFEVLRLNAELYFPAARLFQVGLSDSERVESFDFYPLYTMMSSQSSYSDPELEAAVVERALRNAAERGSAEASTLLESFDQLVAERFRGVSYPCRLRRLSDLIREQGIERIDLLKVDAQRAELDVLRGLEEGDWKKVDQLVMEVHDQQGKATAGRVEAVLALLEERGFEAGAGQDEMLVGTDRWTVWARRRDRELEGEELGVADPRQLEGVGLLDGSASAELRRWVGERLPEPLRPTSLVLLEELPRSRTGKVDRRALPAPEEAAASQARAFVEPRDELEARIAAVWAEVLGFDRVSAEASFFELGGHSLLAIRITTRLRQVTGVEVPVRAIFESPTVAGLAERVRAAGAEATAEAAPAIARGAEVDLETELAELEGLSSEEVDAVAAREGLGG